METALITVEYGCAKRQDLPIFVYLEINKLLQPGRYQLINKSATGPMR